MEEHWDYLLVNGQSNYIKVKSPKYEGIELQDFDLVEPLKFKNEKEEEIKPTVQQIQNEKRRIYSEFFKKPPPSESVRPSKYVIFSNVETEKWFMFCFST